MDSPLIYDRGRGPELAGTRITVYNLLPYFLDPTATEEYVCRLYQLTAEQVAAARAYIFHHLETVLADHLQIEERLAAGNPPEVIEQAKQSHTILQRFKNWLTERDQARAENEAADERAEGVAPSFPTFREWEKAQPIGGS